MQCDTLIKTGIYGKTMQSSNFDDMKIGILLGALAPVIGVLLYYFVHQAIPNYRFKGMDYNGYLTALQSPKMLSAVLRGSLLMNLFVFILALQFDWGKIAQGVLGMTLVYGFIIVILHLL